MIGDLLYAFTNRDTGTQFLETFTRRVDASSASATVTGFASVPADRVWVLQAASVRALGGGAQTCSAVQLRVFTPDNAFSFFFVNDREAARTANIRCWNWNGALYVRGNSNIGFSCEFSAAALANDVTMSLLGYSLPLGNVGSG